MKAYTIKDEICCHKCRFILQSDHGKKANILFTAEAVAEFLADTDSKAKCCYCDAKIEFDSDMFSKLKQLSQDLYASDIADKTAWHNGRFGR